MTGLLGGRRGLVSLLGLAVVTSLVGCSGEQPRPAGAAAATTPPPAPPRLAPPTLADTGATLHPPAELSMELQHHTMMMIGDDYGRLIRALADGDAKGAAKHAGDIAKFADRIPVFMIHVPDVSRDSLVIWARVFKGQILRVAELSGADSVKAAHQLAQQVVLTCGKCHAKYQAPHPGA